MNLQEGIQTNLQMQSQLRRKARLQGDIEGRPELSMFPLSAYDASGPASGLGGRLEIRSATHNLKCMFDAAAELNEHALKAGPHCVANNDELLKRNGDADPGYEQVKQLFSGMVFDGGWDERDPAHQGSWKGRADQSEPGFNVHTYVGSRGTTQLPAFDSVGGDVESVGMPSMNQFQETKYHRSDAVFKDPLSRFEQREGLFGGYLPVISLQFKIADHPPPKPGHCSTTPQPCPSHPGRTFCSSSTAPNQCDHPPAPCPPCPSPAPPPPAAGAGKKTVLVFHLYSHRSLCQDRLGTTHKSVCVCGGVISRAGCGKRHLFLSFPYVCPEPVLAK